MISEKKIAYYEHFAENSCNEECQKIITQLVSEVRRYNLLQKQFSEYQKQFADTVEHLVQTRREADWLAEQLEHTTEYCHKTQSDGEHCEKFMDNGACAKCWRQAAMDAFEDGSHD